MRMRHILAFYAILLCVCNVWSENLFKGDSSFETGVGAWNAHGTIIDNDAADGSRCMEINRLLMTNDTFTLKPDIPYVFSVYLKAAADNTTVKLWIYRTNWDGRSPYKFVKVSTQWQRFDIEIPPQKFGDHNKFWLSLDPQGKAVRLDVAQLEEQMLTDYENAEKVPFFCDVPAPAEGHVFLVGEPVTLKLSIHNAMANPTKAAYSVSVTDYYGTRILEQKAAADIASKATRHIDIPVKDISRKGVYFVTAQTEVDGTAAPAKNATFCVLEAPHKHTPFADNGFFGICVGGGDRIPAVARMGVQSAAVACRWAYMTEDRKLGPNVDRVEKGIDQLLSYGIEPIVYFRRTPTWATIKPSSTDIYPPKDEFIKDYEDFAFKVVSRFKGKARTFQMWGGEADLLADNVIKNCGWTREQYIDMVVTLMKAGYTGVKRANPDAIVQTTAVSGVDSSKGHFPFLTQVMNKGKGFFDEAVCHPYCYPSQFDGDKYVQSPEENDIIHTYNELQRLSGGKTVMNGEYGFAISPNEPLDSAAHRRMAAYMVRSFIMTASCPNVKRLMYYTVSPSDTYSMFAWPNPRPSVAAYSAMARQLNGFSNGRELKLGSMVRAYTFTVPDGAVAALWLPGNQSLDMELNQPTTVTAADIQGNTVDASRLITLSGLPVYIRTTQTQSDLEVLLQAAKLHIDPVAVDVRITDLNTLKFTVSNQLNVEQDVAISLDIKTLNGPNPFTLSIPRLRASSETTQTLAIPEGIDVDAMNGDFISGTARTRQGESHFKSKVELVDCPPAPTNVIIDGDLSEWSSLKPIVLDSTDVLFPPDAMSHGLWTGPADLSCQATVAWDKNYFYFAAKVFDDTFINANPPRTIWGGDCVQMAFDTLNNARTPNYDRDDVEINIGYSTQTQGTVVTRTWPVPYLVPTTVKAVAKVCDGFIIYEMAIPFELIGSLKPQKGTVFGYNFVAPDADLKGNDYWMGITYGICGGKDPSRFKRFILR